MARGLRCDHSGTVAEIDVDIDDECIDLALGDRLERCFQFAVVAGVEHAQFTPDCGHRILCIFGIGAGVRIGRIDE